MPLLAHPLLHIVFKCFCALAKPWASKQRSSRIVTILELARANRDVTLSHSFNIPQKCFKDSIVTIWAATDATYFLNGSELRTYWEKIVTSISLEKKANGKIDNVQQGLDLVMKAIRKMVEREIGQQGYKIPSQGIGLIEQETDEQVLKRYLES